MAASTVYSDNITNMIANPISILDKKIGKNGIIDHKSVATTSIDEVGDIILFGPLASNCIVTGIFLKTDDLDSHATPTLAYDVGLYYLGIGGNQSFTGKTIGTVIDADAFASAILTGQSANVNWTEVTNEAGDIINIGKELWEIGGLSSDPGGYFAIGMTLTAVSATPAAGDVVMKVDVLHRQ